MFGNRKKNKQNKSWAHWFEIPVSDFERAKAFYEAIFQINIEVNDFGIFKMGIFPHGDVGCAICQGEYYTPGPSGTLVYFNANPNLGEVLDRVEFHGGKIIQHKKQISPEHGFMALFIDTEGNRLALHSEN